MHRISLLSLILILSLLFMFKFEHDIKKPIYVCGGGPCYEIFNEFISYSDEYLILTANKENLRDDMTGKYNIIEINNRNFANSNEVKKLILAAKGLYISGGDQYDYHQYWKGTELAKAIQSMVGKIPIFTTSASAMILGDFYFTAEKGSYIGGKPEEITIDRGFISFFPFKNYIIDTHYTQRNRQNRLKEFCQITGAIGIGLDENVGLKIQNGKFYPMGGQIHYVKK